MQQMRVGALAPDAILSGHRFFFFEGCVGVDDSYCGIDSAIASSGARVSETGDALFGRPKSFFSGYKTPK